MKVSKMSKEASVLRIDDHIGCIEIQFYPRLIADWIKMHFSFLCNEWTPAANFLEVFLLIYYKLPSLLVARRRFTLGEKLEKS